MIKFLSQIKLSAETIQDLFLILSSSFLTFFGSWFIEWFKKRKNKIQEVGDVSSAISGAAKESVDTVKTVIEILDERLQKEREYFISKIEESKIECEKKISDMKLKYEGEMANFKLLADQEKFELRREIDKLKSDKKVLAEMVKELQDRLSVYDNKHLNE